MGDMNVELWRRLPSEILEQALSFLSVPVLCRFRTVCKRWNSLICEPAFGALCFQHAKEFDACFLVARYAIRDKPEGKGYDYGLFGENHGWSFLDLNAMRWYTIKYDEEDVFDCFEYGTVAMDGGLACQLVDADDQDVTVFISNPIDKTSRELPSPPHDVPSGYFFSVKVDMVVNNSALTYKIFLMPSGDEYEPPLPMVVYESTTDQWRTTAKIPMLPSGDDCSVQCSVFFDGLLYILMCRSTSWGAMEYWLRSYNHIKDAWTDTCVHIHSTEFISPQLIVTDNRLFLASWLRKHNGGRPSKWSFQINEVLVDQTHIMVFQILLNEVAEVFDISHDEPFTSLHAFGFRNSIILMCKASGASKMYDLSTSSWVWLPNNPLVPLPEGRCWVDRGCWLDYGKPMNLILPASTRWVYEPEGAPEASSQSI